MVQWSSESDLPIYKCRENADRFDSYTRYLATLGEQKLQQAMNTVRTNWKTGED
jgi:hypothetical protein